MTKAESRQRQKRTLFRVGRDAEIGMPKRSWRERPDGCLACVSDAVRRFTRDEGGAMIVFCVLIFGLMLAFGGLSFDLMRYEMHRNKLQSTLDRAVLAASSVDQERDPKQVVLDYMQKAGMIGLIDKSDIVVTEGLGSRKVEATARVHVPLHHGAFKALVSPSSEGDTLVAVAHSGAEQGVNDFEISLVLDVSASMMSRHDGSGLSLLETLKDAAQGFVTTTFDNLQDQSVAISVVPYSTQVSAGPTLMSYLTRTNSHTHSFCLNFEDADFKTVALPTTRAYEQTLHINPRGAWSTWDLGEPFDNTICPMQTDLHLMPWETDPTAINAYIEALETQELTSIDLGAKWGAALLDPSMRPVVSGMISTADLPGTVAGHPVDYGTPNVSKVMVVLTDGENSSQWRMTRFRDGDSFVWKHASGDGVYYSVWHDGARSTPDLTYETDAAGTPLNKWFVAYNDAVSSGDGGTQYMWQATPYDDADDSAFAGNARRLTWDEVWAEIPPRQFGGDILFTMGTLSRGERDIYDDALNTFRMGQKNDRLLDMCSAAKDNGITIFTIGLETSAASGRLLEQCASSPSHHYDVDSLTLSNAFNSIARHVSQLKLTQ